MNDMITSPHDQQNEDYPQISIADTDWTDEEREAMREHGYDDMDLLRAWISQCVTKTRLRLPMAKMATFCLGVCNPHKNNPLTY